MTKPTSREIKIKHTYTESKNSYQIALMKANGFAENQQLLPYYGESVDMTLINQVVN